MEADGPPLFPPGAACTCGEDDPVPCLGMNHEVIWEGGEFKGTRCARHGGHKFRFAGQPPLDQDRPAPPD